MPLSVPGIKVWLRSGGSDIPLYASKSFENRRLAVVPSEAGQAFEICASNKLQSGEDIVCDTYIDGRMMDRLVVKPNETCNMEGVYVRPGYIKPYQFSYIQTTEDEESSVDLSKIGDIKVLVWRAHIKSRRPDIQNPREVQAELDPIPEKEKKDGWHTVKLGNEIKTEEVLSVTELTVLDNQGPHAIFYFLYRSKDFLEEQGIIRRSHRVPKASKAAQDKVTLKRQAGGSDRVDRNTKRRRMGPDADEDEDVKLRVSPIRARKSK